MSDNEPGGFPAQYDPLPVEEKWYRFWETNGLFTAHAYSEKPKFSIVIPPPNITGSLHVGHALNNTLQDIQIRFKKLQGFETLWLPGTDHASIGTHTHLDRALAAEGTNRFKIGREEFLKRAWAWKEKYGTRIIEQLKLLGCACDWSRTRFTMDEMCSNAVREAFVRYYEEGLIYRGNRIVNWCPRCHTAVSDLEVKRRETDSHWWYIRYPFQNPQNDQAYLVVATTRPETMLGDTAVAVNPADERYQHLIGQRLMLPLVGRSIPIVPDQLVLSDFGTGAVKVTPAHDPVDFEIAQHHGLEFIKVIDEDARMTEQVPGRYQGLTREECRELVIADLKEQGLLEKTEPYRLSVGVCERCGTVVEPLISKQWFVRMAELAKPAIEVVEKGRIRFIPERWTKVYLDWMNNVRDWCISRQLWWGHRIPVFYCRDCGEMMVGRTDPKWCSKCQSTEIQQDEDVLDTWFSSALWPFSTMGWPYKSRDLERFYPTDFLSTAPDIIFLWVARMIFSSLHFLGEIPFSRVYFHSFILVETGERMSRSKGVGIDPVDMFRKYGTDAVRFTLTYLESQSQSYRLSEKRFEFGRNFTNKLWNACRLVAPHIRGMNPDEKPPAELLPVDNWLIGRYDRIRHATTLGIESCTYSAVAAGLYDFFWHDLCDWYLEFAKQRLKTDDPACRWTLFQVFSGTLRLLHPIMPFITEELWHRLGLAGSIMQSSWPDPLPFDRTAISLVETMKELIVAARNIRSEMAVPARTPVPCIVNTTDPGLVEFLKRNEPLVCGLAKVTGLTFGNHRPADSSLSVLSDCEIYVPLAGIVDIRKEQERIRRDIAELERLIAAIDTRLSNPDFVDKAKLEVVERERERRQGFAARLERLRSQLSSIQTTSR